MRTRLLGVGVFVLLTVQLATAQAAERQLCALFTAAEITKSLGTAVASGESVAMGTGCQWFGKDETSYAIIQAVDAAYWVDPKQTPGYETIQGVGKQAYTHPDVQGGWRAMGLTKDAAVTVVLIGSTATRTGAATLLRQLLERR